MRVNNRGRLCVSTHTSYMCEGEGVEGEGVRGGVCGGVVGADVGIM